MKLSKRLETVASMVTKGNRAADVGCDHGFVPIFLVESGISPLAVAADVRPGPLSRAKEHIKEHRLEEKIRLIQDSDAHQKALTAVTKSIL